MWRLMIIAIFVAGFWVCVVEGCGVILDWPWWCGLAAFWIVFPASLVALCVCAGGGKKDHSEESELFYENEDYEDNQACEGCESDLSMGYPEGDGCPLCLPCGGGYAPGTEECDFCNYRDECAGNLTDLDDDLDPEG